MKEVGKVTTEEANNVEEAAGLLASRPFAQAWLWFDLPGVDDYAVHGG